MKPVCLLVTASPLLLALQAPVEAQEVVVKMATLVPDGSRWHLILKETAEKWKAISGGRVVVRLYPGGVAGDDSDMVRKMRASTLSAGVLTASGLAEIDRSAGALGLPLVYDSYDEAYWVLEKMRPRLEAGLLAGGFVALSWADVGWTRFFTEKPVATPDELRALKIFAFAGDSAGVEMLKAARFNPVPLPSTELATALGNGLVTALAVSPQIAVISQFYTRARNMTDLPWQLMIGATLISKAAWEKIPADLRPALLDASREAGLRLREEIRASGAKDIEEMKKRGLRVVPVDTKARVAWNQASEAMLSRARGTIVPAEAFDEALRLRDEYRKRPPSAR